MITIPGKYTTAKIYIDNVDEGVISQITKMINHEAFTNPVAIMPDTHQGKGSVIGFTMKVSDKLIPNVIGVDIGCSVSTWYLGLNLPEALIKRTGLKNFDNLFRKLIPTGFNIHETIQQNQIDKLYKSNDLSKSKLKKLCKKVDIPYERALASLGTLGGGNHFVELGYINTNTITELPKGYYLTIHTGSRQLGKKVCEYWTKIAQSGFGIESKEHQIQQIQELKKRFSGKELGKKINKLKKSIRQKQMASANKDLAFLTDNAKYGYLFDMYITQEYARCNHFIIANIILEELKLIPLYSNITTHNYIEPITNIIRKGAISARKGELCLIPLTMADGTLVCRGKGNPDWNYSAPHGAGRILSRSAAKRQLSTFSMETLMANAEVEFYADSKSILDESPQAYKNPEVIKTAIQPTVDILGTIYPILNIKAS